MKILRKGTIRCLVAVFFVSISAQGAEPDSGISTTPPKPQPCCQVKKNKKYFVSNPGAGPFKVLVKTGKLVRTHKGESTNKNGLYALGMTDIAKNLKIGIINQETEKKYIAKYKFGRVHAHTTKFDGYEEDQLLSCRDVSENQFEQDYNVGKIFYATQMPKYSVFRKPWQLRKFHRKIRRAKKVKGGINKMISEVNQKIKVVRQNLDGTGGSIMQQALRRLLALRNQLLDKKDVISVKLAYLQDCAKVVADTKKWKIRRRPRFPLQKIENFACKDKAPILASND